MTRTTTGHPTRALAGLAVLLVAWTASRVPAMRAKYDAAIGTSGGMSVTNATGALRLVLGPAPAVEPVVAASLQRQEPSSRPDAARMKPRMPPPFPRQRGAVPPHEATASRAHGGGEPVLGNAAAVPAEAPAQPSAGDFATDAYARLAAGDRRAAVRLFDAAIGRGGDPRAAEWAAARARLVRRWSRNAYSIVRSRGAVDLAVTPVLGGGQSGGGVAFTPDPLARRPLALTLRGAVAHDDRDTALGAVGVAWRLRPGLTFAAERVIAVGAAAKGAWTMRLAGGATGRRGPVAVSAYGEAGVVGDAGYAAAQARAEVDLAAASQFAAVPGVGAWASFQHDGRSVGRVDIGPGVRLRHAAVPVELAVDYRVRIAGNAAPGTGLVLTVSAGF